MGRALFKRTVVWLMAATFVASGLWAPSVAGAFNEAVFFDRFEPRWFGDWTAGDGYQVSGSLQQGSEVVLSSATVSFGEKPGGGPPILWDFGAEAYVHGEVEVFNSRLAHLERVQDTPLYDREARGGPHFYAQGATLRHPRSAGHYLAQSRDSGKAGAYFMGVNATGGKTSMPYPFRDNRYYFSMRVIYPEGIDDNSLKTVRGSQRDSQQHGWYGSRAPNINKYEMKYRENNVQIWPPEYKPVWSGRPEGWRDGIRDWHLEELFIDPSGSIEPGRVWHHTTYYFRDAGRREFPMAYHPSGGSAYMPTEYWESDRGYYHQVGPEPAGYRQPDYHFGEIYIDDSFKRLYLADSPDWDEVSSVELQRPLVWTDNEIRFALNLGAFEQGQMLFLFWVDDNNQAHLAAGVR